MPRFYVNAELAVGRRLVLPRDTAQHALRVLRLTNGEVVTLFNGHGGEYVARLVVEDQRKATACVDLLDFDDREAELPFDITVAQGLSGGDKMEWTIEKAIELGAVAIQPLACMRSVVRLSGERALKRMLHWRALCLAACAQCGRNRLPVIHAPLTLDAWLGTVPKSALKLLLSPRGTQHLATVAAPHTGQPVLLLVGPEGGFTVEEEEAARVAGFTAVSIGPRILRTETAAAAALAMLAGVWNPQG